MAGAKLTETIMVTGGAGFIGSHVCEALLERGTNVVCVDNFNSYYNPKIKESNIQNILKKKNFELIREDVTNSEKLRAVFKRIRIDKIIHLAAMAGVRSSIQNPLQYQKVNINGTINLLSLSVEFNAKNFVYGSSSSVYGDSKHIPFSEDKIGKQISPYAVTKRVAEIYCEYYHQLYGLNINILRFFTVYGPRGRPDMAVYKFTKEIDDGQKLIMYGDGSSMRDYTYVEDIVGGIVSASEKELGFEIINLGNSNPIKLTRLINLIEQNLNKKAKIEKKPMQEGDVFVTCADISKAKRILGYNPSVDIEQGIKNFVDWYKGST